MQFAINEQNTNRFKPVYSGQKAICPFCNGGLIGKCGEIYAHHLQHNHNRICDPWKEHETQWHRKWKANFPYDWQEVIIEKGGEKHIADVKTSEGLVVEFQNSSISSSTIRISEEFYEQMVWVINAKSFRDNFELRSIVSDKLRGLDETHSIKLGNLQKEMEEELVYFDERLKEKEVEFLEKINSIKGIGEKINMLNELLNENDEVINQIINNWMTNGWFYNYLISDIVSEIGNDYKLCLQGIEKGINKYKEEISSNEKVKIYIENLEDFEFDYQLYKIVAYDQLKSEQFNLAIAITKSGRKTFFPQVKQFISENEFLTYKYQQQNFDFAINLSQRSTLLDTAIKQTKEQCEKLQSSIPPLRLEIKNLFIDKLQEKIQSLLIKKSDLNMALDELIHKKSALNLNKGKTKIKVEADLKTEMEIPEKNYKEQRFTIMKEYKGLYYFNWKHERKSWKASLSRIYFDIGEDYLLLQVKPDTLKKISVADFLKETKR